MIPATEKSIIILDSINCQIESLWQPHHAKTGNRPIHSRKFFMALYYSITSTLLFIAFNNEEER